MADWAGVIGAPIDHSLSPVLHTTSYRLLGIDWEFRRLHVRQSELEDLWDSLDDSCRGLAVTMPCKQAIVPLVDSVDGLAKGVGAVNTVSFAGGLSAGFNTDVHGIVETVRDSVPGRPLRAGDGGRAVILGTRATASSALAALTTLGYSSITIVGRQFAGQDNVLQASSRMGASFEPLLWTHQASVISICNRADLVVSTVPPDATAEIASKVKPRPEQRLLDVTYSSGETPLNLAFQAAGATVLSPLAMLTYQGIAQVKLWTGREVPFEPVYEAVRESA